jgi:hypothetical protein
VVRDNGNRGLRIEQGPAIGGGNRMDLLVLTAQGKPAAVVVQHHGQHALAQGHRGRGERLPRRIAHLDRHLAANCQPLAVGTVNECHPATSCVHYRCESSFPDYSYTPGNSHSSGYPLAAQSPPVRAKRWQFMRE